MSILTMKWQNKPSNIWGTQFWPISRECGYHIFLRTTPNLQDFSPVSVGWMGISQDQTKHFLWVEWYHRMCNQPYDIFWLVKTCKFCYPNLWQVSCSNWSAWDGMGYPILTHVDFLVQPSNTTVSSQWVLELTWRGCHRTEIRSDTASYSQFIWEMMFETMELSVSKCWDKRIVNSFGGRWTNSSVGATKLRIESTVTQQKIVGNTTLGWFLIDQHWWSPPIKNTLLQKPNCWIQKSIENQWKNQWKINGFKSFLILNLMNPIFVFLLPIIWRWIPSHGSRPSGGVTNTNLTLIEKKCQDMQGTPYFLMLDKLRGNQQKVMIGSPRNDGES